MEPVLVHNRQVVCTNIYTRAKRDHHERHITELTSLSELNPNIGELLFKLKAVRVVFAKPVCAR